MFLEFPSRDKHIFALEPEAVYRYNWRAGDWRNELMKFGVIVFPGSNCDRDMAWVTQGLLGQPTRMVWHQDTDLSDIDIVVLPGGFSYGDYLRCGAIAQFSPVMRSVLDHAAQGKFVLGVCNGFQVLTEVGLLPGAIVRNRDLHFICDRVPLKVERTDLPWTHNYNCDRVITLPIAHGDGSYYADADTLAQIEDNRQVVFRYCTPTGELNDAGNPNGSLHHIAGICNDRGNVLGMMPHPERASDPALGNTDGMALFEGLLAASAVPA
jgi:phosphoribosylformylglycinamidine synthase